MAHMADYAHCANVKASAHTWTSASAARRSHHPRTLQPLSWQQASDRATSPSPSTTSWVAGWAPPRPRWSTAWPSGTAAPPTTHTSRPPVPHSWSPAPSYPCRATSPPHRMPPHGWWRWAGLVPSWQQLPHPQAHAHALTQQPQILVPAEADWRRPLLDNAAAAAQGLRIAQDQMFPVVYDRNSRETRSGSYSSGSKRSTGYKQQQQQQQTAT